MNQARTMYQSDYSSYDWYQNNFTSEVDEFCCSENIDECLKYISQEFSALGYPSIYSPSSDCPFAVNCDIVKLLNTIYEFLKSWNAQNQSKDDLECRNQRLSADLNVLNIKNNQLKNSVEQLEKKLANALERERQLKEKSDQLAQSLKNEKDEAKRLAAQLRQQKVTQQREIRKHENSLNQIKTKLNQLLTDKTPNKKIVTMSTSHSLPRNTGQRGKWQTSTTASSALEDMYNSMISNYEARSKDTYKEVLLLRHYLQSVLLQTMDVVSLLKGSEDNTEFSTLSEELILSIMNNECSDLSSFDEKFTHLFTTLKEIASSRIMPLKTTLENETSLKSKLYEYENIFTKLKESHKDDEVLKDFISMSVHDANKADPEHVLKEEKKKLAEERLAFAKSLQILEREKAEVSAQKFAILKLATEKKESPKWNQGLTTIPSLSVMTSKDGTTTFSNLEHLRASSSSPDHIGNHAALDRSASAWNSCEALPNRCSQSKSDTSLTLIKTANSVSTPPLESQFFSSNLPSWAVNLSANEEVVYSELKTSETAENTSTSESERILDISSGESIQRLQAAVLDIERKRKNLF